MAGQVKTLGVISLIIGILSLLVFCIPVVALIMAVSGFVLGISGIVSAKKSSESNGLSIAGTVLSGMALLIGIVWNIVVFTGGRDFFKNDNNNWFDDNDNYEYYDNYDDADTNYWDVDSLMLDEDEIDDLNQNMDDEDNGPGPAPG